ncbi:MAG: HlyC/CorC family transporter [Opitutus sp.]|nr:HlyC/CorC family transporter [Opitutus sp.]
MNTLLVEIVIIFLLLLANGAFALAEISVVSSRKGRLKMLAIGGSPAAAKALALAEDPGRFLSSVQIGITLVGILAGAFGGATLSEHLARAIARVSVLAPYSSIIGLFAVVGAITYASLIIGELVPKRIGLNNPEKKAMLVAVPLSAMFRFAAALAWLLTISTEAVLKIFRLGKEVEAPPSEEQVSHLIAQGTAAGGFHQGERQMVEGVLRLDERAVTDIMTRRSKIVFLDVDEADDVNWRKIVTSGHSQFPVYEGSRDEVIGMVAVKALWANAAIGLPGKLRDLVTPPLFVPRSVTIVQLLESFKQTGKHLALVTDEYGAVEGIVSLIDVMEAIVGDLPELGDRRLPDAAHREDGSWLVDGAMKIADLRKRFRLGPLPGADEGGFESLGGFVLARLGQIPHAGEYFEWGGWRFEVMDMDQRRVDKLLLTEVPSERK